MNGSSRAPLDARPYTTTADRGDARLHGRWLLAARVGWILVVVVVLGLDVLGTEPYVQQMYTACVSNTCLPHQLMPAQMRALLASGVSLAFFVAYEVAMAWIGTLVYAVLAVVLFLRRPDDRMAMFGAYTFMIFGAGTVFGPLNALSAVGPFWAAVVSAIVTVGSLAFYAFFCLFPGGRFAPKWMRWVTLSWIVGSFAALLPYPPFQVLLFDNISFFVFFGLLVFTQVYRYRCVSSSLQREQTKWVVLGFAAGLGGFIAILLSLTIVPDVSAPTATFGIPVVDAVLTMTLLLIPIFIAVAILRSRLWDIDVIINRTLVYGSLTVALAAVYFGVVIGLQAITQALTGQTKPQSVIIVASTLLIAALFNPLRHRLQQTIDRRFYRRKYDAAQTLETFTANLRSETDMAGLTDRLGGVVTETMRPAHVSLWLRTTDRDAHG